MKVSFVSNIINIIGNAIFIYGFNWNVAGAALSTLISRVFCTVVIFYFLRKPRQVIVVKDYLKIRPDMPLIWKIMAIGIPSGVENGMFQFGKLAIQSTVSTMGTVAIAAQAMTNIMENVNGVFGIGVGIGLMTVVGQCMGAGRSEEAKYYIVKLCKIAWVGILFSCLFVFAITKPVTMLAGMEKESAEMCFRMVTAITIVKPISWVGSFIIAYGLRAAGDVKFSMTVSTITMWFCRVALCIFLVRVYNFGPMAVWIGMFADWTIRSVIFAARFISEKWLKHKVV
jgi:Na+-driven multidrug efflux pump